MAVSLLDLLVSGRPDRFGLPVRTPFRAAALLGAAVAVSYVAERRARGRR